MPDGLWFSQSALEFAEPTIFLPVLIERVTGVAVTVVAESNGDDPGYRISQRVPPGSVPGKDEK